MEEPRLLSLYYVDETDPDILVLCRQDGSFVAAFSPRGATRHGIFEASRPDWKRNSIASAP